MMGRQARPREHSSRDVTHEYLDAVLRVGSERFSLYLHLRGEEGRAEDRQGADKLHRRRGAARSQVKFYRDRWRKVIGHAVFPQTSVCKLSHRPCGIV